MNFQATIVLGHSYYYTCDIDHCSDASGISVYNLKLQHDKNVSVCNAFIIG